MLERKKHIGPLVIIEALRNSLFLLLAVFFINLFGFNNPVWAASFQWSGDNINFEQKTFSKRPVQDDNSGQTYYFAYEGNKAHALIFSGDPKIATTAKYVIYDVNDDKQLFNPQEQEAATLNPVTNSNGGSCQIEGIGWIVCPLFKSLSKGMDAMYGVVSEFITLRPITDGSDSLLAKTWEIIRNIANSLFSVVFLVIILSYLTGKGLSNYDIKKMLPKLIVSALLVNLSFYLCVLAVDFSNILGNSISGLFKSIQNQTMSTTTSVNVSWTDLGNAVLQGGTIVMAGGVGIAFAAGGLTASLLMLAPALIGAAISLIITIILLSARQAIIIALIVISPLAFIAYTMPNTEQYFKKWLDWLKATLLLQPIFVFIYSAAQLASLFFLLNATNGTMLIAGMIIQVVPLIILPKLVRNSDRILSGIGSALDKVAAPINATAKNRFDNRRAAAKQKWLAEEGSRLNPTRRFAQFLDRENQRVAEATQSYDSLRKSRYAARKVTARDGLLHKQFILENEAAETAAYAENKRKEQVDILQSEIINRARKADDLTTALKYISKDKRSLAKAAIYNKISQSNVEMAADKNKSEFVKLLQKDIALDTPEYKGKNIQLAMTGVYDGAEGSTIAVSAKIATAARKEHEDGIKAVRDLFAAYKLSDDQLLNLAFAKDKANGKVEVFDSNGNKYVFDSTKEKAVLEAAAGKIVDTYNVAAITTMENLSGKGGPLHEIAPALGQMIRDARLTPLAGHLARQAPDIIARGLGSEHNTYMYQLNDLIKGRFGKEAFAVYDKDYTEILTKAVKHYTTLQTDYADDFDSDGKFSDPEGMGGFDKFTIKKAKEAIIEAGGQAKNALLDPELVRKMSAAQQKNIKMLLRQIDEALKSNLEYELNNNIPSPDHIEVN